MSGLGNSTKPCPSISAQSDYYEHDQDESLYSMTCPPLMPSIKSVSTPTISRIPVRTTPASAPPSSTGYAASSDGPTPSRGVSRDSQFPHRILNEDKSRIPRRVKSTTNAVAVVGTGSVSSPSLAGSRASTAKPRSNFTSSAVPSVVSTCLLSSGGDGISLDPDVEQWLDIIPLSRKPFKNFHRDFADGVLMAEIMCHFFPKKVDLHNYVPSLASPNKRANFDTLNQKVFSKMGVKLADNLIDGIVQAKPGFIEKALRQVHKLIDNTDRKYVYTRAQALSFMAGSYNGSTLQAPFVEDLCLVRTTPGEIPDCIIYQNIKYHPSTTFEEMTKSEEQLREKNNELCNKVRRLDTLLNLKETHLQDLTSKIHELRSKYESSGPEVTEY